jgi:hypothetical protein
MQPCPCLILDKWVLISIINRRFTIKRISAILLISFLVFGYIIGCTEEVTTALTTSSQTSLSTTSVSSSNESTSITSSSTGLSSSTTTTPTTTPTSATTTPLSVAPTMASETTYVMGETDLVLMVQWNDNSFESISGHAIVAANYAFDDHSIVIDYEFLNSLGQGTYVFSLKAGVYDVNFTIEVIQLTAPTLAYVSDGIHNRGDETPLLFTLDLGTEQDFTLTINGTLLSSINYQYMDQTLTLLVDYLDTLPYHDYNVIVVTTLVGSDELSFITNDYPTLSEKIDFIKYPGESVINENFTNLITNQIGSLTYAYALNSGEGLFTDHEDGTFSFIPNGTYNGIVSLTMTVTDEYFASISKTYELIYKTVNPIIFDATGLKVVDKIDAFADIVMTTNTYGIEPDYLYYEMLDVTLNSLSIGQENIIFKTNGDQRLFSIKQDYLRTLPTGVHTFTLFTEAGQADFTIEVKDSRLIEVDISEVTYKKTVSTGNLVFNLTFYEHIVTSDSFTIDGIEMVDLIDYNYDLSQLTLESDFINGLAFGHYVIKVNDTPLITLIIEEAIAPEVASESRLTTLIKADISLDLIIDVMLYDMEANTLIKLNSQVLNASDYQISLNQIRLTSSYLLSLGYGNHEFTLETENGTDTFDVNISDKPLVSESQNVTKFTYEAISSEHLRVEAISPWVINHYVLTAIIYYNNVETITGESHIGMIGVDFLSATGDFGGIQFNELTNSFQVQRASGWYGVIVFTYIAFDSAGVESDEITMDVVFKQVPPIIADKDSKVYVMDSGIGTDKDIVYTITNASGNADFPVIGIVYNQMNLLLGTDFTIGIKVGNYRYFTIKASYLATLSVGDHTLILQTDGGSEVFHITVLQGLWSESLTNSFDKGIPQAVVFTLLGSPLIVTSLMLNSTEVNHDDYTFEAGVLTLQAAYLSTFAYESYEFVANNGVGSVTLTVEITDTRVSILLTETLEYVVGSEISVFVDFNLYVNTFEGLLYGEASVNSMHYQFLNNRLTLNGSYLESLYTDQTSFEFTFLSTPDLTIVIDIVIVLNLPSSTLLGSEFEIDTLNDVYFTIDLNGNTFEGIAFLEADWIIDVDYEYDFDTHLLRLYGEKLITIYRFSDEQSILTLKTVENHDATFIVPYDHASARILNGGFETGNLYGWNAYTIWKDEVGLSAFLDSRVVSNNYFTSNPYHRDGTYNLGIVWDDAPWDQSSERMGHLVSAPFVLSGSGWISFKLGGGRDSDFAYISIRRTSDNIEIARFGNSNFNNTALATSQYGSAISNAEAFMFQYYFDLSEVASLGDSLYITITEAVSFDWSILSVDSFLTYYSEAPSNNSDTLADNILPTILNIETASNTIVNGSFDTDLSGWSFDGVNWYRNDDGTLRSNPTGDGNTGVIRSSAFTIASNPYLRLDWAGGLRWEKQIYISIKEVGTNIEVLRFVVRSNLSTKENLNFDNHMLDLSSLDVSKKYYLELSDNRTGSWGVAYFDNIRFVSETEWNAVTSGDRAQSISGINTDFSYQLPY